MSRRYERPKTPLPTNVRPRGVRPAVAGQFDGGHHSTVRHPTARAATPFARAFGTATSRTTYRSLEGRKLGARTSRRRGRGCGAGTRSPRGSIGRMPHPTLPIVGIGYNLLRRAVSSSGGRRPVKRGPARYPIENCSAQEGSAIGRWSPSLPEAVFSARRRSALSRHGWHYGRLTRTNFIVPAYAHVRNQKLGSAAHPQKETSGLLTQVVLLRRAASTAGVQSAARRDTRTALTGPISYRDPGNPVLRSNAVGERRNRAGRREGAARIPPSETASALVLPEDGDVYRDRRPTAESSEVRGGVGSRRPSIAREGGTARRFVDQRRVAS